MKMLKKLFYGNKKFFLWEGKKITIIKTKTIGIVINSV